MTKLTFQGLGITAFKSFKAAQYFDLSVYGPGLHFIRGKNLYKPRMGPNGVGKSALWDALVWCLFGKTVRDLRNPDVKPWSGIKGTSVTAHLLIDKEKFAITRTASPNRLTSNDEEIGQDNLETLLGLTKEVFCHTILLGQGQDLFLDLKPKDKMDVFNTVLHLDKWDQRSKNASKRASLLQSRADELNGKISGLTAATDEINGLIADARTKAERWEKDQRFDERTQQKELNALKKQRAVKQNILDTADLAYDSAATEVEAIENKISSLQSQCAQAERDQAKTALEVDAVVREKGKLIKERDALKSNKTCPTCGQTIRNISDLKKHVAELTKQIGKLQSRQDDLVGTETEYETKIKRFERSLDQQRGFEKDFVAKAEGAEAQLSLQKRDISELNTKIQVIEQLLARAQDTRNPHSYQVKVLIKRRSKMMEDVEGFVTDHKKLLRRIERVKFWVKGFKDVQLYIIEEVLQELELVSNAMLTEMGLEDWEIKYAIEKETQSGTIQRGLNVTVLSPDNDKPVRWECWSGGEGQRLRVLGALALSEVLLNHAGITTNIEILDEPTRGLSDEGVSDLCKYLALRSEQLNKQCWLIDHAVIPSANFTSTLTVTRDTKGRSMLKPSVS